MLWVAADAAQVLMPKRREIQLCGLPDEFEPIGGRTTMLCRSQCQCADRMAEVVDLTQARDARMRAQDAIHQRGAAAGQASDEDGRRILLPDPTHRRQAFGVIDFGDGAHHRFVIGYLVGQ